jgi:Fur family peroxide stress response transcriptional regulator
MVPHRGAIKESFRRQGVRCTAQRYAILEYLINHPVHPTAEEIHRAINKRDPRASLATVYKALHALAESGLIRELNLGSGAARFEYAIARHHHFVCAACGRAEDIPWFDIPGEPLRDAVGARLVTGCELVVRGACERCRTN